MFLRYDGMPTDHHFTLVQTSLFKKLQRSEKCGAQKGTDEELGQFEHPVWQMLVEPIGANLMSYPGTG